MRLQDLPILVIGEIASYLPSRDVIILAQQSDALHYACKPQLRQNNRQLQLSSLEDCCDGFNTLLWTLCWPPLGQYVRHITMHTSYCGECLNIPRPSDKRSLSDKETTLLKYAVRRAGYEKDEYDNMWLQISTIPEDAPTAYNLMSFTTDEEKGRITAWAQALAAIFISTAPNLESFSFAPVSWQRNHTWEPRYMLKQLFANLDQHQDNSRAHTLINLRCIRLLPWGQHTPGIYESYPLSVSMKLVGHLPSVETCCVEGVQSLAAEKLEPAFCHFKYIRIHQSCLSHLALIHVIRSCKELQEFDYCFGSFETIDVRSVVHYPDLLDALGNHTETLRVLDLDLGAQRTDMNRYEDQANDEAGAKLADFIAMTHLRLGMDSLLYFAGGCTVDSDEEFSLIERLPPQLETLTIYGYRPGENALWDEQLEELRDMIVDGDECVFTLRGVNEYLRHPTQPENPELEPGVEESTEQSEHEGTDSDSDASDMSWLLAPAWYREMHPRRQRNAN